VDSTPDQSNRGLWAFWIACALAAVGAVAPFLLSGGSDRINGALIPFAVAALFFALCARLHHQGRPVSTLLYFVASLAVVYGILSMLALPLRLAVLGTCPTPGPCPLGLEQPMTSSETTALGFAIGMGIVSILAGFFGLRTQYHRHRVRRAGAASPTPPPRRIPPVGAKPQAATKPDPAVATETSADHEPQAELPAHEPDLELPAHTTESAPAEGHTATIPAPASQPKRQRKTKTPPDPPTSTP
jgi:hypothetical protein